MDDEPSISIVNIVASGELARELDLASISSDPQFTDNDLIEEVDYRQNRGNRLLIRFVENNSLCILTTTGVYIFTGGKTYQETEAARQQLFNILASMGILSSPDPLSDEIDREYAIRNIVFVSELSSKLNLNTAVIELGFEKTEYEPEQFPGLIYRPANSNCTILIFASGKIVVTGVKNRKDATDAIKALKLKLRNLEDLEDDID